MLEAATKLGRSQASVATLGRGVSMVSWERERGEGGKQAERLPNAMAPLLG